ncbi:MAG: GldG family protein [Planctomycetes bacterium]|nr:GldG family protein [Planctomycetota bacterium]
MASAPVLVPVCRPGERGAAPAVVLHVVLLVVVLAQVVYLASRHRVRIDLTTDQLWSASASTRAVLDRLDQRLLIEAYFSPQEKLPVLYRESRKWAESFLDELVQLGQGKVVLQRYDPNGDDAVKKRAERVGVKPLQLQNSTSTSMSIDVHWQGLRLRLGDGKQKVITQFLPGNSFQAEAMLTPALKELVQTERRRFGYMEWPVTAVGQQVPGGIGWNVLRTLDGLQRRYEFQNFKDEDGALLPDDLDTLFLFRPKELTDRQKYVIDQFVVGGGTLVVFADAAEYALGPQRVMTRLPLSLDASGSTQPFLAQLLHYGIDWKPKVVADVLDRAIAPSEQFEYLASPGINQLGQQVLRQAPYPYFFHALAVDWKEWAGELAKDARGKVDEALAASYRQLFVPGMPSDEFLFQACKRRGRGPGFYWPTWVGLREKSGGLPDLPNGVEGRVLLWSSPKALVEDPPQSVNPFGNSRDAIQQNTSFKKFWEKLKERLLAEPRLQVPLMVEVEGRFASVFAGQPRPQRPSEIKEAEARKAAGDSITDPTKPPGWTEGQDGAKEPPKETAPLATERAMRTTGEKPGRIVMIGDADFVRDDIVRGDYAQSGGPFSGRQAPPFFAQLLDWLAEDADLVALQSRSATVRTLDFARDLEGNGADPRLVEQAVRNEVRTLRWLNVVVPCALLAALGFVVRLVRGAQKRAFLAGLR